MTRVLSGAVLIALGLTVVWLAPPGLFFAVAELLLFLGFIEYAALARASGLPVPAVPAGLAAMLTCAAFSRVLPVPIDVVLISALVALGALTLTGWIGGRDAIGLAGAAIFPALPSPSIGRLPSSRTWSDDFRGHAGTGSTPRNAWSGAPSPASS